MRTALGRLVVGALTLTLGVLAIPLAGTASPRLPHPVVRPLREAPPARLLPAPSHGRRAIERLGAGLDRAARSNDMTAAQLRRLLVQDRTAWVGAEGRVFYREPLPTTAPASPAPRLAFAAASTFGLHSKPDSTHVVFLDFDGADVSGTAWNDQDGVAAGFHPGWSLDLDPTTFSVDERAAIQSIWQQVAEDYAPFDVDVTTEDPGEDAIDRSGPGDSFFGTRALISPSADAWSQICDEGCGGVAYLTVFDETDWHSYYQPAWIFPQALSDDPKAIGEAVSHEVGHNFGLQHDGNGVQGYDEGHAPWAPIMGVGYYQPITQWSKGDYANANNHEDDVSVIASHGAPVRADEGGSTVVTAAAQLPGGPAYIASRTDVDVYALGSCSGSVAVSAVPAPQSPDLDIRLSLLAADGSTVATDDPLSARIDDLRASGMGATVSRSVATAPYFVAVDGVGNGSPVSGYDDYASLGAYTLSLTSGSCGTAGSVPSVPQGLTATPAADGRSVTVRWSAPASDADSPISGYTVSRDGSAPVTLGPDATSEVWSGLTPGTSYTFTVAATNVLGAGPPASTVAHTPDLPSAPTDLAGSVDAVTRVVTITWQPPASDGGSPVTAYDVLADGVVVGIVDGGASGATISDLAGGGSHDIGVRATNGVGTGPLAHVTLTAPGQAAPPAAARIGRAVPGRPGGRVTATARWLPPGTDGGAPVSGYQVYAYRLSSSGRVLKTYRTAPLAARLRSLSMGLPSTGRWRFAVRARNVAGWGPLSARSDIVRGR